MGYMCDFCGNQRSVVHCRSDDACLCLDCDNSVHSANSLSRRHSRTLVCQRCNSQPAGLQCAEEKISLCQSCDWIGHGPSTSGASHKRREVKFYSDCPSASELRSLLLLDSEGVSGSMFDGEREMGLMSITEGDKKQAETSTINMNQLLDINPDKVWSSSAQDIDSLLSQGTGNAISPKPPKLCFYGTMKPTDDEDLYFNFDMVESELNLENYEELFRVQSEEFHEKGIDNLFEPKDNSHAELDCSKSLASQFNQGAVMVYPLIQ